MDYRKLGESGLSVSPLCLGTMMFGGPTDEATATHIVAKAGDAGINFIDTADTYNRGRSEEVTGRAIAGDRDRWVLASKLAQPMGDAPNQRGLTRKWIMEEAENSLRRLGTDYIDILYLHREDHDTPMEQTVRALGDLARDGKIRYFGLSNYQSWRVAEMCNICHRAVDAQPLYNAMNRMVEVEHLPAFDRQVRSRRLACRRQSRRSSGRTDDAVGMASGIPAAGATHRRPCRGTWHNDDPVRG
jgi:aryl-alcohol dehydrogenase (NADP+)